MTIGIAKAAGLKQRLITSPVSKVLRWRISDIHKVSEFLNGAKINHIEQVVRHYGNSLIPFVMLFALLCDMRFSVKTPDIKKPETGSGKGLWFKAGRTRFFKSGGLGFGRLAVLGAHCRQLAGFARALAVYRFK